MGWLKLRIESKIVRSSKCPCFLIALIVFIFNGNGGISTIEFIFLKCNFCKAGGLVAPSSVKGGCRGVELRLIINLRVSIESVRGVNGWLNYPRLSLDLKLSKQERKAFTKFQERS